MAGLVVHLSGLQLRPVPFRRGRAMATNIVGQTPLESAALVKRLRSSMMFLDGLARTTKVPADAGCTP